MFHITNEMACLASCFLSLGLSQYACESSHLHTSGHHFLSHHSHLIILHSFTPNSKLTCSTTTNCFHHTLLGSPWHADRNWDSNDIFRANCFLLLVLHHCCSVSTTLSTKCSLVCGQQLMMWIIVCHLPHGHLGLSVVARPTYCNRMCSGLG